MQKVLVPIGVVTLLGFGLTFYNHMMSDEMVLQRLGYEKELIQSLMKDEPELVQQLIEDHRYSEEISDYIAVNGFNYDCYDAYVQLSDYYSTLSADQIVYLATFLDHVFIPTLYQQGYTDETIKLWFQSNEFNDYVTNVDIMSLNRILNYAKETGTDLETLMTYVNYEIKNPYLKIDQVVSTINEYQSVVVPALKSKGYETGDIDSLFFQCGLTDLKNLMETTLTPDQAMELMTASSFDSSSFAIYDEVLSRGEQYSVTYALQFAKYPNVKANVYDGIVNTPNQSSLLVLVNKNYRLAEDYVPTDFIPVSVPVSEYSIVNTNYLRRDAADATDQLFAKALEAGHELTLRMGYVSYSSQKKLYDQDVYEMGLEYADTMNDRPGHSEHQTGLAIDITTPSINNELSAEFATSEEGKWVLDHAHEFGFIIRYSGETENEVGNEPYHLRYVGVDVATEIYQNNWTLEDYVLNYALLDQTENVNLPEDGGQASDDHNQEEVDSEENDSTTDGASDEAIEENDSTTDESSGEVINDSETEDSTEQSDLNDKSKDDEKDKVIQEDGDLSETDNIEM